MGMADGGTNQITPADARTALEGFGHGKDALGKMPDADVVKLHGTVTDHVKGIAPKLVAFGEGWREQLAGQEKDDIETLKRFTDPSALWKRTKELTTKLSKGELKAVTPFPKDGDDAAKAAWRKDNGVPESPDKYDVRLPNNLVIGDDDKPMVEGFLKHVHGLNWDNQRASDALGWYFGNHLPAQQKMQADEDMEFRTESQAQLAQKWGPDRKRNYQAVSNFLSRAPEALRARLWGGRLADGRPIGDDPEMLEWFASMELEFNPATTFTGKDGANALAGAEQRIKEIEKVMKTDRAAYNKDEKMQEEYRQLLDAVATAKERGKAKA